MNKQRLTQITLAIIILLGLAVPGWATTYYVSNAGSDNYNGLYPAFTSGSNGPWLNLAKVQTPVSPSAFSAGDFILFRRGDTFRTGTVGGLGYFRTNHSGAPGAGNSITYGAYGSGPAPIFTQLRAPSVAGDWAYDSDCINYVFTFNNVTTVPATGTTYTDSNPIPTTFTVVKIVDSIKENTTTNVYSGLIVATATPSADPYTAIGILTKALGTGDGTISYTKWTKTTAAIYKATTIMGTQSGLYMLNLNGCWGNRQVTAKTNITTWGDFYYDATGHVLYLFTATGTDPVTYYGVVQASYDLGSSSLMQLYNHTYIDVKNIYFQYFGHGIEVFASADYINITNCLFNQGQYRELVDCRPIKFTNTAAASINVINCLALGTTSGFKLDVSNNSVTNFTNCASIANIASGFTTGSNTYITLANCDSFGNYSVIARTDQNVTGTYVNGGGNIDANFNVDPTPPQFYLGPKPKIALVMDDAGLGTNSENDADAQITLATNAGVKITLAIPTINLSLGTVSLAHLNSWANNPLVEIGSHSIAHIYIMGSTYSTAGFMTIKAASGGACNLWINNTAKTLSTTGAVTITNLSLAVGATPNVSTVALLASYLSHNGFTVTVPSVGGGAYGTFGYGFVLSSNLADVTNLDISSTGSAVSLNLWEPYFTRDETAVSKAILEAVISGSSNPVDPLGVRVFTIDSGHHYTVAPTNGAIYYDSNGTYYTVVNNKLSGGVGTFYAYGWAAPVASPSTLTKASGTGDVTIYYSAFSDGTLGNIGNPLNGWTCKSFVYPGNYQDACYAAAVQAAGYTGARGIPLKTDYYLNWCGINVFAQVTSDCTSFAGYTQAQINSRIATIAVKGSLWGFPLIPYFHSNTYASPYTVTQEIIKAVALYGTPVFMSDVSAGIVTGTARPGLVAEYIKGIPAPDFRLLPNSPLVKAGSATAAPHGTLDITGKDLWNGRGAPPIGAYANPTGAGD